VIDETVSAPAEGEALPVSRFKRAEQAIQTDAERVIAAIERWYAAHFHAAAAAGTAPLSADDKAALIQHVADAVAPPATQE
jgi:hypothetical protein